jgi:GNAT superfamily N-acetyltransferase
MLTRRDDGYEIDTDPGRLDLARVHEWLSTDAYWALGRPLETVSRSVDGSLSFGVYAPVDGADGGGELVGFARVVTDLATFAWLCDVYIARDVRGKGVGSWLVEIIRDRLLATGVTRILLATGDAHAVYAKLGFAPLPDPDRWMVFDTREQ